MLMMQTLESSATGEDLPLYKVSGVGRFVGKTGGQSNEAGRFDDNVKQLNEVESEIKGWRTMARALWQIAKGIRRRA
jgi:hypothetical protein